MTRKDLLAQSVSFTATPGFSYGQRIVVVSDSTRINGKWSVEVSSSHSRDTSIEVDGELRPGERYIVIERQRAEGGAYRHRAVLPEDLEEATESLVASVAESLELIA